MTNHTAKILSIEVGYESSEWDTCTSKEPEMSKDLTTLFGDEGLAAMSQHVDYPIPAEYEDDTWASEYLRQTLNVLLNEHQQRRIASGEIAAPEDNGVRIHESDDLRQFGSALDLEARHEQQDEPRFFWSGSHGTRCKKQGRDWVNSRTYRLMFSKNGKPWPSNPKPKDAFVFATLTWLCWSPSETDKPGC